MGSSAGERAAANSLADRAAVRADATALSHGSLSR